MAYFEDDNSNINDAYLAAQGGQVDQLGELFGQYAYDPSYYDYSAVGGGGTPAADPAWMTAGAPSFEAAMKDWSTNEFLGGNGGLTPADQYAATGAWENWGNPETEGFNGPAPFDEYANQGDRWFADRSVNRALSDGELLAPPTTGTFDPMKLGPNNPTAPVKGNGLPGKTQLTSSGKLRTWDTKTGREIGQVGGGNRGGGGDMAGMIQGYNDAVARARNAAEADRNQALQAVAQWRQLIEQRLAKNPFGAEYKSQTLGVVRDARARQYSAAVEELRQAYAQQGKPLDPRLLTMLRMQMSREENGDLRSLSVDTAGKAYEADRSYVNEVGQNVTALDRILSNTNRQPNPQELAFLMSLSRSN
jgi:hypothetical protein